MRHIIALAGPAIAAALLLPATSAKAAETWVSGRGADTGTCTNAAPCKTFAYALTRTPAGGTINVLSPGNFGPVVINKAVSIVADGVEAVINATINGSGISVAVAAAQTVSLRGLTINMMGLNNDGIEFKSGGALHVKNCVVRNGRAGVAVRTPSGNPEIYISDTVFFHMDNGLMVSPTGSAKVVIERARAEGGTTGFWLNGAASSGAITATIRDSIATGNAQVGILTEDDGSGSTTVMIDHVVAANNQIGIRIGTGSTARFGNSTVAGNSVGVHGNGGTMESYGTNKVDGNSILDVSGAFVPVSMQ
jgi:parallel beta helix pectate lyase-like protein